MRRMPRPITTDRRFASAAAVVVLLSFALSHVSAQAPAPATPLPEPAAEALAEGEARMAEALATYQRQYPDRALWQAAFQAGRRAVSLAPERVEPVRFLAEAYSRSNWYGPAWTTWMDYVRRAGAGALTEDHHARELIAAVGHELAYGAYARGDFEAALEYHLAITDLVPTDLDAHVWAGRILIETERPAQAVPFWRTVTELDPLDQRAAYFLELAQEQARWGTQAVNAFRDGVQRYEQGMMREASERFARATTFNDAYPQAWAWLGRVAFESGEFADAVTYYGRAIALDPGNETYRYFHREAQRLASPTPAGDDG
jgi:tetratricopeptide (TPR) repeat protein